MKNCRLNNNYDVIVIEDKRCPSCRKKILVEVEKLSDGESMDEMNTVIKLRKS